MCLLLHYMMCLAIPNITRLLASDGIYPLRKVLVIAGVPLVFDNLLTCKDCHFLIMNVIESNIIQSNITNIFILAYEYVTESVHISKTHIKARKVH